MIIITSPWFHPPDAVMPIYGNNQTVSELGYLERATKIKNEKLPNGTSKRINECAPKFNLIILRGGVSMEWLYFS